MTDNSDKDGGDALKVERNINSDKVKAEDAMKREKAKAAHQQKVARYLNDRKSSSIQRDKEQREKEAQKKEKAKKRAEKGERRGRG